MHITTSSHILSLADDHVYHLRKIGVAGDDSWLESRRGEAFDRRFQVVLDRNQLVLYFEGKSIGGIALSNTQQVAKLLDFVKYWNLQIGPTDLNTIKTVELVRDWPQLIGKRRLQVKTATYNCAGALADLALRRELWTKLIGSETDAAEDDVIAVGFQESDNLNRSVKANAATLQIVADFSKDYLYRSHTLVSTVQLLGLMTLVFVRSDLCPYLSGVTTDTSSTGFLRMWGNKGAVLTRFYLFRDEIIGGGLEVSIVNCHLSAGEGVTQLGRRRWELKEIGQKFGIASLGHTTVEGDPVNGYEEDDASSETDSISSISEEEIEAVEQDANPPKPRSLSSDSAERETLTPGEHDHDEKHEQPPDLATQAMSTVSAAASAVASHISAATDSNDETVRGDSPLDTKESDTIEEEKDDGLPRTRASRYTVLLGDMNYRILLSDKEVQKKVKNHEWDGLLAHDSLSLEKHQHAVFRGFEEPAIRFAPTYKYQIGTSKFSRRVPSYTDRIMYRTLCPTKVVSYGSVQDLKLSDHRPVVLRNHVEPANCINPEKYSEVMARALRIADDAENNARPKLAIETQQIVIEGAPLSMQQAVITIRNEGVRPVNYVVENAQEAANETAAQAQAQAQQQPPQSPQRTTQQRTTQQSPQQPQTSQNQQAKHQQAKHQHTPSQSSSHVQSPPRPALSPSSSAQGPGSSYSAYATELVTQGLEPGNIIRFRKAPDSKDLTYSGDVSVSPHEGRVTSSYPTATLKLSALVGVTPRDFILLVRSKMNPAAKGSAHGASSLVEDMDGAVQKYVFVRIEPTKSYLGSSLKQMPQSEGIPVPIRECIEYLRERRISDMFLAPAEPTLVQQALKWLDADEPLDRAVLDQPDPTSDYPAGIYAVAQLLLSFFRYLPDPIMGPDVKRKMSAEKDWQGVLAYVCKFINELQLDLESLDIWAAVLYDHTDQRVGKQEKRAYLRSMLICN